jgi:alpha-ribazole phosphatase
MIYLIRHGETEANIKHIYCGSTDLPLSSSGIEKLKLLKYDVGNAEFITSGMQRTEQTLKLLFGDVDHKVDPRFREIDFGIFEMCSYYDLKDTPEYQKWLEGDNEANVCPGGESGRQMEARVIEAFSELSDDTVVVTHGGVIAAIMTNLFPDEDKNRFDWQPAPGHGYVIISESEYKEL